MFKTWVTVFTVSHSIRTSEKTQFFIQILFGKEYKFLKHILRSFLYPSVASSLLFPSILHSSPFTDFFATTLRKSNLHNLLFHSEYSVYHLKYLLCKLTGCFLNHTFLNIQGDSKRWTEFRTSIFPELYMVCE